VVRLNKIFNKGLFRRSTTLAHAIC